MIEVLKRMNKKRRREHSVLTLNYVPKGLITESILA